MKWQIGQASSWYLCVASGSTGTKQSVNQGQREMQCALQLPQFWHCAVMFSRPGRGEVNSGGGRAVLVSFFWGGGWSFGVGEFEGSS